MDDKKNMVIKKLNEDDILEVLLEYYQEKECASFPHSRGMLLGIPGEDLRFIGIYGQEDDSSVAECDLSEVDKTTDFNGDHSFLEKNPRFHL
jgi:hypothetical protein